MYPGFADLLIDNQVAELKWKTDLTPAPKPIETDAAMYLSLLMIFTALTFF